VGGLRLLHLGRSPGLHAVTVQQAVVDVLVVHHEQAGRVRVGGPGKRVVVDAVVVHAELRFLLRGGVAGVEAERRVLARDSDRFAPQAAIACAV
jgi:hypothetical protein